MIKNHSFQYSTDRLEDGAIDIINLPPKCPDLKIVEKSIRKDDNSVYTEEGRIDNVLSLINATMKV